MHTFGAWLRGGIHTAELDSAVGFYQVLNLYVQYRTCELASSNLNSSHPTVISSGQVTPILLVQGQPLPTWAIGFLHFYKS